MDADDDLAACRAEVVQFLDSIKILLEEHRNKYLALTDGNRKRLSIEPAIYAFNRLDKHLVAPIAKTHRAEAKEIYRTIHCLALGSFQAGAALVDTGRIEYESLGNHLKFMQSSKGGKNKNPPWAAAALPHADAYVAQHPCYLHKQLAFHLRHEVKIADMPDERAVLKRIAKWQKEGKLACPRSL
jgi:hypothetical protein